MKKYQVINIQEADYGCEECSCNGPKALLTLKSVDDELCCQVEAYEQWLFEAKIDVGSIVTLNKDNKLEL